MSEPTDVVSIKGPTGREIRLASDRYLLLLTCRHWFQALEPQPTGALWDCPRCRHSRNVLATLTSWDVV